MKKKMAALLLCCLPIFPVRGTLARAERATGAECVLEADSGRILYASNAETALPMASTTKIVTAITVLERAKDLSQKVVIPREAEGVEGSSVYLKAGEEYGVDALLYGLMLRSGNDCAVALAISTAGSVEEFAVMMNRTAERAGALCSHFVTPHGLHDDEHYTTALDLCRITSYALRNETFQKIVATKMYEPYGWRNKNKMLDCFDGAIGVKTGYTKKAGKCLVSAAKREDMTLVCTVLNCPNTYDRSSTLLEDAFRSYRKRLVLDASTPVEVEWNGKKVTGATGKRLYYPLMEEEVSLLRREVVTYHSHQKTPKKGEIIGEIKISLLNRLLFSEFLYKL